MKSLFEILCALHPAGLRDEYLALRHYIDERDALLDQQKDTFTVLAGRYEDYDGCYDRNYKYCEDFTTLDEAISAYDKVKDYPWVEIEYKDRTLQVIK